MSHLPEPDMQDEHEQTPGWWKDYYAEFGSLWHVWENEAGFYARRLMSSPPAVVRADSPDELAEGVREAIRRRPGLGGEAARDLHDLSHTIRLVRRLPLE